MNLLFVPDVADYSDVYFKHNHISEIGDTYKHLEKLGIPVGNEVLLLTANPIHKVYLAKKRVVEAGFKLDKYLPLQLIDKLLNGLEEAINSGPVGVEAHYRDCSAAINEVGMFVGNNFSYRYASVIPLMSRVYIHYPKAIEDLEELVSKHPEVEKISIVINIIRSLETTFNEKLKHEIFHLSKIGG